MKSARSLTEFDPDNGFASRTGAGQPQAYDVNYSYDPNGNLLTLQRYDGEGELWHDFTYTYYSGTNKLMRVVPIDRDTVYNGTAMNSNYRLYNTINVNGNYHLTASEEVQLKAKDQIIMQEAFDNDPGAEYRGYLAAEGEGSYVYDQTGNLIWDQEKGVKISWTPYGKVRQVTSHNGENSIEFQYDPAGNRIRKTFTSPDTTYSMSYLRDASGNVLGIYNYVDNQSHPIYGSSRVGEAEGKYSVKGQQKFGGRTYEISNHLGNVLASISDRRHTTDSTWVDINSVSDYYPFGLQMPGRVVNDYRYGFNGKEKDQSFGNVHYDYGFRIYNPAIAKFLSVDPLTSSYPWYTPYQFAGNKPIIALDLDGLEEADYRNFLLPNGRGVMVNVADEDEVLAFEQHYIAMAKQIASNKALENRNNQNSTVKSHPSVEKALDRYWNDRWNRTFKALGSVVEWMPVGGSLMNYQEAKLDRAMGNKSDLAVAGAFGWFVVDLATMGVGGGKSKVAKEVTEETVTLYRAVGMGELADIFESGLIRPGEGGYINKLFAETFDDALAQGIARGEEFSVIAVDVAKETVDKLYKSNTIDVLITEGRNTFSVYPELLGEFNKSIKQFLTTPALKNTDEGVKVIK